MTPCLKRGLTSPTPSTSPNSYSSSTIWLASDHDAVAASLTRFVGARAYGVDQLRDDLDRFAFLLDGNHGERLFDANTA
jgi:hypothetical protein